MKKNSQMARQNILGLSWTVGSAFQVDEQYSCRIESYFVIFLLWYGGDSCLDFKPNWRAIHIYRELLFSGNGTNLYYPEGYLEFTDSKVFGMYVEAY